jgi:hypothetical protein
MSAYIQKDGDVTASEAGDNDRICGDITSHIIAFVGNLTFVAHNIPRLPEQMLLLQLIDLGIS